MKRFEGSYRRDSDSSHSATVMECGVCWWVYDPGIGDPVWQVPPGTAFAALPEHWRCPNCDAVRDQFMVLRTEQGPDRPAVDAGHAGGDIARLREALDRGYRQAATAMRTLPVYNSRLEIHVIGLRHCEAGIVGVVATPWCMNLVLKAAEEHARREGSEREVAFPSGSYSFIAGHLHGAGQLETCSLYSPMDAFDDPAVVVEVAQHVMVELFKPPASEASAGMTRRSLLRPGATA